MKTDRIEKSGSKFRVVSKSGRNMGEFATEAEAKKRLAQIERFSDAASDRDRLAACHMDSELQVKRVDFNVVLGEIHFDPEREDGVLAIQDPQTKFLRVDARLTRVGVFTYFDSEGNSWGELRTEDQVFDPVSMRSFEMAVVTDDHPEEFVNSRNVKDVQVGSVGTDVRRDGDFLRASVVITDAEVIQSIKDGKRELSCGYTAQIVVEPGVTDDGTSFAGRQTNIRGNHVAVVDRGRAGPDCKLMLARGDAFSHTETEGIHMKTIKLLDGTEIKVPAAVADAYEKAMKADADGPVIKALETGFRTEYADQFPPKDEDEDKDDSAADDSDTNDGAAVQSSDDTSALKAKVDMLEAQAKTNADTFNDRVDARSKLVASAVTILGAEAKTDGRSDAVIMRDIVLHVVPSMKAKLDANKGDAGYLRCAYEQAVDLAGRRDAVTHEDNSEIFEAMRGDGNVIDFEGALSTYNDRNAASGGE